MMSARHVLIFFLDGVGVGAADARHNPFITANRPNLDKLLWGKWFFTRRSLTRPRASLVLTDATLGVAGKPQSATGQATILTGRNIAQAIGEHWGPKPNDAVQAELTSGTLFHDFAHSAALLNAFPDAYFDAVASGRRLRGAVAEAAVAAGVALFSADHLKNAAAISPDFTNEAWRTQLGYLDMPPTRYHAAGRRIASLAQQYTFSFYEHWPSDMIGHRGTFDDALDHIEQLDIVIGGVLDHWDDENGLLIITSDHGNMEAMQHRHHTDNPVPTILVNRDHAKLAQHIHNLTDVATVVRKWLIAPHK